MEASLRGLDRGQLRVVTGWVRPLLDGDARVVLEAVERARAAFYDPEASFMYSVLLCRTGHLERGLELLEDAVQGGFCALTAMADEPSYDPLRGTPRFEALREQSAERRAEALDAYRAAGGYAALERARAELAPGEIHYLNDSDSVSVSSERSTPKPRASLASSIATAMPSTSSTARTTMK